MVKAPVFCILLGLAIFRVCASEASPSAPGFGIIHFSGEVSRGESLEKRLWNDLIFVLKATDSGWDISVTGGEDRDSDFVWVVTPPYRFDNARYLGTVYGHSAADAVAWTPRAFSFVTNPMDYVRAGDAVRKLLWPSRLPEMEIKAVEKTLAQVPKGNGMLKITGAKSSATKGDFEGRIESLSFEVEIRPPIDPREALRRKFLQEWPEYQTVEEACPSVAEPIRIGRIHFHDFDGDGFDEAVVLAHSCLAGTGGTDLSAVFTRSASGEVAELEVREIPSTEPQLHEGLRGKMDLKIEDGILVEEFPVYRDDDSNCCPAGGVRRFFYRFDGKSFVLDKFEDLPAEP